MPLTEDIKSSELGDFANYREKYSSMKIKLKAILYVSIEFMYTAITATGLANSYSITNFCFLFHKSNSHSK